MLKLKGRVLQYSAAISAALFTAFNAIALYWPSPTLPLLMSEDSPIGVQITANEASLITSMLLMGSTCGNIVLGLSIDYFGRKGTLLITALPVLICWITILFAKSVTVLCVARFIMGVFLAAPISVSVLYVGEISEAPIRGKISFICMLIFETFSVLTIVLGAFISYENLAITGAVMPFICFISFLPMPESPYFYVKNGDLDKAERALKQFRDEINVNEELKSLCKNAQENLCEKNALIELFTVRRYRTYILLIIGLKTLQQFSGGIAIQSYMKIIFEEADTGLDPDISSIISISVVIPTIFVALHLVDKFGRKNIYYTSTIGTFLAMLCESVYFFLKKNDYSDLAYLSWLPITGIFLYYVFRSVGINNLPFLIVGELFPTSVKGSATSLSLIYGSILATLISYGFPGFSFYFGMGVSFLIFALCCFAGFIFIVILLPETKNRTLTEIQSPNRTTTVE